jgi:hypothetical protein
MDPSAPLDRLAVAWRVRTGSAVRLAFVSFVLAALVAAGFIARRGTTDARLLAALLIALVFLGFLVRALLERRALKRRDTIVRRLVLGEDRALGERVLRALALERQAEQDPSVGSLDLARLHLERAVGRIPAGLVSQRGTRVARRFRRTALLFGLASGVAFGVEPPRVFEGLDVLAAQKGIAPIDMTWLESVSVLAQPPAYLRAGDHHVDPSGDDVAAGSVLVVRGVPARDGRQLVLTDGKREVPFSDDGALGVVARYTVESNTELRIAARFGDVLVRESAPILLRAIADEAPVVRLEGGARRIELESLERLELRYSVNDDHGLRQIDLVLRSGGREDRRVLEKIDGQARSEQGAQALDSDDPFIRRMFLPIEVTIEAKDNDVLAGSKWGRSEAITLVPPAVGAPEAARFRALLDARGKLLDLLAWLSARPAGTNTPPEQKEIETRRMQAAGELTSAAGGTYAGSRVNPGLASFLTGQAHRLQKPAPGSQPVPLVEDVVLAVDSALRSLATRDAQSVSKRLGDAAEEAADGFAKAQDSSQQAAGLKRARVALEVLDVGVGNLLVFDVLGADLGSVARGELRRIRRAEAASSLLHAELAARHLAARLKRPTPSFGSAGGGGGSSGGGVEAGHGSGAETPEAPPSEADRRFNEVAEELEQLMREHAALIEQVDRDLSGARDAAGSDDLRKEAAERAAALRQAIESLPRGGAREGSGRAAAALAREHATAMAERLERLELEQAKDSGSTSRGLIDEAQRKARAPRSSSDLTDLDALDRAQQEIARQLAWAEEAQQRMARDAEQGARERLSEAAEREKSIERRMGDLTKSTDKGEPALPEQATERLEQARNAMREAVGELSNGRGERGLERQREAQRLLEQGSSGRTTDGDQEQREEPKSDDQNGGNGKNMQTRGPVPAAPGKNRAEEFRRRVLQGLAKDRGGRLDPAVRRYAEGLLE